MFQRINRFQPTSGKRSLGVLWLVLISYCLIWLHPFIHPLLMTSTPDFQQETQQHVQQGQRQSLIAPTAKHAAILKDNVLVECAVCKQIGANPPFQTHLPTLDFQLPPLREIWLAIQSISYRFQRTQPPARAPPFFS